MWEDAEKNQIWTQNQAKEDDWSKETQKEYSIYKRVKPPGGQLNSLSPPCESVHIPFSLLINTCFALSISSWEFISTKSGPGHWSPV